MDDFVFAHSVWQALEVAHVCDCAHNALAVENTGDHGAQHLLLRKLSRVEKVFSL